MTEEGADRGAPRSSSPRFTLPRAKRLRRHNDFLRLERTGVRAQGVFVTLSARPGRGRLGFTVSRKVSLKATVRNLVRRTLKEILRMRPDTWAGLDLVVIARPEAVGRTRPELEADVVQALVLLEQQLARAPRHERDRKGGAGGKDARTPRR